MHLIQLTHLSIQVFWKLLKRTFSCSFQKLFSFHSLISEYGDTPSSISSLSATEKLFRFWLDCNSFFSTNNKIQSTTCKCYFSNFRDVVLVSYRMIHFLSRTHTDSSTSIEFERTATPRKKKGLVFQHPIIWYHGVSLSTVCSIDETDLVKTKSSSLSLSLERRQFDTYLRTSNFENNFSNNQQSILGHASEERVGDEVTSALASQIWSS